MSDQRPPEPRPELPAEGRCRVVIEGVRPEIDGGRHPVKRVLGEEMLVSATLVGDGTDLIAGVVHHRRPGTAEVREVPLRPAGLDRYEAPLDLDALGRHGYRVEAWVDAFATWRRDLQRRVAAGQDVTVDLRIGAGLVRAAADRATGSDTRRLGETADELEDAAAPIESRIAVALGAGLAELAARYPDRGRATLCDRELEVIVDDTLAGFSAWYELFPRSFGPDGRHGTLADAAQVLSHVAAMGFDVVYLPPIHPIGRTHRKGRDNAMVAEKGDPGSPWAVGGPEGGHMSVHPELGTVDDLRDFVLQARSHGLEVALDIAFQASPDHPWVTEHPQWFRQRPDGTIQYAENPPKKYQDIHPFDFESEDWRSLWIALRDVFLFWVDKGVRVFRVDNPHTKALPFWEWCIADVKARRPDAVFLAEAFTRPALMYALAKRGFTQSYTYFTWRNTKRELTEYMEELCHGEVAELLRPSFWPNTPDILPEHLQYGGRPIFIQRAVLAATLSSNWGIYGPAFELMENLPRAGAEEYSSSEKYELRRWDISRADSLSHLLGRLNGIRKDNPALWSNRTLMFHPTDNEQLICYSKTQGDNAVVVVVNLDPHHRQAGFVELDMGALAIDADRPFQVHELVGDARFLWEGARNYIELDPQVMPAHVLRIRRRVRTEHDFDYFF